MGDSVVLTNDPFYEPRRKFEVSFETTFSGTYIDFLNIFALNPEPPSYYNDNQWGIKWVRQRPLGCFPAVVSMLTGVDYDVLPDVSIVWDRFIGQPLRDISIITDYLSAVSWDTLRELYRINYGIDLAWSSKQPDTPSGRVTFGGKHIVVHLPDGNYIDPDPNTMTWGGVQTDALDAWLVALPYKPTLRERVRSFLY